MKIADINNILRATNFERTAGNAGEFRGGEYIFNYLKKLGLKPRYEGFSIPMYETKRAELSVCGKHFPCCAFFGSGVGTVTAPIYLLSINHDYALKKVKDKIVLLDGSLNIGLHEKLLKNGALGIISYGGNLYYKDCDISQREIRFPPKGKAVVPTVEINAKSAVKIASISNAVATLTVEQTKFMGESRNIVCDIPGNSEEIVVLSAHYDSTPESMGAYDNMSGCIGLFYAAEHFLKTPHTPTLRLLFCGAEERGLLGSKAYCKKHKKELESHKLNINLDMLGSIMGQFKAFASCNEEAKKFMADFAEKQSFDMETVEGIRSSDSNVFADCGVAAISFARYAGGNTAPIHTRYDTRKVINPKRLLEDVEFVADITEKIVKSDTLPFSSEITESLKAELDKYFLRTSN